MANFVFHCIGDKSHGFGHVMRDLVMARELRARGHDVRFVTEAGTPGLDRIKSEGFPYRTAGQWYSDDVLPYVGDVMILDLEHGPSLAQLQDAREVYPKVVNVGGVGFAIGNPDAIAGLVDLEIYGGELFSRQSSERLLAGPRYLVIDPEYSKQKPDYERGNIVVSMGGADPHGLTISATWAAANNTERQISVVRGPACGVFLGNSPRFPSNAYVINEPSTLSWVFGGAALCITATGMTAYEALAAGVPCLLTNWSGDHLATAQELERRGCAINLGTWQDFDTGEVAELVRGLSSDRLAEMGAAGRRLVDGLGVYRVCNALEKLTTSERETA